MIRHIVTWCDDEYGRTIILCACGWAAEHSSNSLMNEQARHHVERWGSR